MATKVSTIEQYIKLQPEDVQIILQSIRQTINKVAIGAEENISYGIPAFKLNGKQLVFFAAFKNHIGFYATPTGHQKFKQELSAYTQGKGSVQFPLNKPMPLALIKRIVQFRMNEQKVKNNKITKTQSSLPVEDFIEKLNHPLKKEILFLRKIILGTNSNITENIKWNAPNFCYKNEDRITMRIPPNNKNIQLIFHCGAKVKTVPKEKLIDDTSEILTWKTNDRAIATFISSNDIKTKAKAVEIIINKWINSK